MREIRPLTGLRGVAALMVVLYHITNVLDPSMGRAPHWHSKLYLCVDIFFVLSGFVVTLNYHALFTLSRPAHSFTRFMIRRIARLYPLYFVATIFLGALRLAETYLTNGPTSLPITWQVSLSNILMIQTWGISPSIVAASWSISTEMFAYLLFPLLVVPVMTGSKNILVALGCGAALLLASAAAAAWQLGLAPSFSLDVIQPDYGLPLLRCLAGFVTGMLTCRIFADGIPGHWIADDRVGGVICLVLAAGLGVGLPDLALYPLFPAVVLALSVNKGRVAWLFGHPVLHWLGLWSYSLYLIHGALQRIPIGIQTKLSSLIPAPALFLLAATIHLTVVLALSALCYSLIEVPGRRIVMEGWAHLSRMLQTNERLRAFGLFRNS